MRKRRFFALGAYIFLFRGVYKIFLCTCFCRCKVLDSGNTKIHFSFTQHPLEIMRTKDYRNRWLISYASYLPSGYVKIYPLAFNDNGAVITEEERKEAFPQKGAIFFPSVIPANVTQNSPILKVLFKDFKNSRYSGSSDALIGQLGTTEIKQYNFQRFNLCLTLTGSTVSHLLKNLDVSVCQLNISNARNRLYICCDDGVVGPFDIIVKDGKDDKKRVLLNGVTELSCVVRVYKKEDLSFLFVCNGFGWELSLLSSSSVSLASVQKEYSCISDEMLQEAFVRCLDLYKAKTPIALNVRVIKGCMKQIIQHEDIFRFVPSNRERILSLLDKISEYGELVDALKNYLLDRPRLSSELVRKIRETYPHFLDSLLEDTSAEPFSSSGHEIKALETQKEKLESEIRTLEQVKAEKETEVKDVSDKLVSVIQSHIAQLQTKIESYKTIAGGFAMQVDQGLLAHIQTVVSSLNIVNNKHADIFKKGHEEIVDVDYSAIEKLPLMQYGSDLKDTALGNELIKRVQGYLAAKNRFCSVAEVANYLVCLTQGFMTTFAGNPGSGKTSLCNLLAKALGLVGEHDGTHFVDVPVSRGWTSAKDFIGYHNPLTKEMVPSNAAVYKALELSEKEDSREVPPMVILLDEVNLSPLEHYWSSFLKNSDFSSSSARSFSLGGDKVWKINPHLRFLATVNHDHTTEELSPRFLDRSWVILLDGQSSEVDARDINIPDISGEWAAIPYAKLEEAFGVAAHSKLTMKPEVLQLWKAIRAAMQESQMRIMPRNVNMVENYVKAASLYMSDTFMPLDYAMAQKILPTLSGSGERMKDCLTQLHRLCDGKLPRTTALLTRMLDAGKHNMEMYQFFVS